jgi:hypothetical protein
MEIKLNAYRINKLETTCFLSLVGIDSKGIKIANKAVLIHNSFGEYAIIFHFKLDSKDVIRLGNDTYTFKENILTTQNKLRVFYWNDEDDTANNLECFHAILETYRLDTSLELGDFECLKSGSKSNAQPRQAGNGGVLGIIDIP